MCEDVDDTDEAGHPADDQYPDAEFPGLAVETPAVLLIVPTYEVDSLQDIRHGVSEADGQVEQEDFEDGQLAEGGVEPGFGVDREHASLPSFLFLFMVSIFNAGMSHDSLGFPPVSVCKSDCQKTFDLLLIILIIMGVLSQTVWKN